MWISGKLQDINTTGYSESNCSIILAGSIRSRTGDNSPNPTPLSSGKEPKKVGLFIKKKPNGRTNSTLT